MRDKKLGDEKYYARFKHFLRINLDRVESFRTIKGFSLKLEPKSVDAFVCYNVLEHLSDSQREKLFEEIKRTLKEGGVIVAGYVDEDYFVNKVKCLLIKHQVSSDSTDLVSWKLKDFIGEIEKHFKIVKSKRTSPYGRYIFFSKYLKGELILMAKSK